MPARYDMVNRVIEAVPGPFYVRWRRSLFNLARLYQPLTIVEVGTLHGKSAIFWAYACPDAAVYTIDDCIHKQPILNLQQRIQGRNIITFIGSPHEIGETFTEPIDLFYIGCDRGHENILESFVRVIAPGCIIPIYDYNSSRTYDDFLAAHDDFYTAFSQDAQGEYLYIMRRDDDNPRTMLKLKPELL